MPLVELTLLAESFTQNYYLGKRAAKAMTGTIRVCVGFWLKKPFGLRMIYYLI
jgi:hypothetical protein